MDRRAGAAYSRAVITCPGCGQENPDHARFCLACATSLEPAPPPRQARKTVTVLFCDVVGSTSLGERLDPEALRQVMGRYFDAARSVVERHGGTVEKFIGDAVMAVFGIPELHEDDALRAVRAAAELRDGLESLNAEFERDQGASIAVRIGVNTGEVVAGDASAGQRLVTGDPVNLAARLEQAAGAGEIVIGQDTHRLVRDAVEVERLGPLPVKGKGAPVVALRLLRVRPEVAGFLRRLDSPIVGRDHELSLLSQAFARAVRERSCHLFTILGAPGVGKSRLSEEFLRSVEANAQLVRGRCLPYGEGITFWPAGEVVRAAAGIGEEDAPESARGRIASLLTGLDEGPVVADRVAQMIGLAPSEAAGEELFWGFRRLLETLARRRPLVVLFDDIHWAEPTMLDLIEHVADWARDAPMLVVCLSRPDLLDRRATWGGGKLNATSLLLESLTEAESEALVSNLLGRAELAEAARHHVIGAAEGNPLFVEQMLSMLIDDGLLRRDNGHWVPTGDLTRVAVPPNIQALIAARLDRLRYEERAVIEGASVVGQVFYAGAVSRLSPEPVRPQLSRHLMGLVRKELIRPDRSDVAGEDAFRFRHILIRDTTYDSMPKQTRAELHELFAAWLEPVAGPRLAEFEEILGYHLEQAYRYRAELGPVDDRARELANRAAAHLAASGRRALARSDASAAESLLTRAIGLIPRDSPDRPPLLLDLASTLKEGMALPRAREVLDEAVALARAAGDRRTEWLARVQLDHLAVYTDAIESDAAMQTARGAINVFGELGDDAGLARAWYAVSEFHNIWGQQAESIGALERAVEHAGRSGNRRLEADLMGSLAARMFFGPSRPEEILRVTGEIRQRLEGIPVAEMGALRAEGRAHALLGHFDQARELLVRALAMSEDLGQIHLVLSVRGFAMGFAEWMAGDFPAAEREFRAAVDLCQAMGERASGSTVAAGLADALYEQGRYEEAERYTRTSEEWGAPDDMATQMFWRRVRGKVLARLGRMEEAERLAKEAAEIAERTDFGFRGDVFLDLAEVLRMAGRPEEALTAARRALEMYEEKGSVPMIARTKERIAELEGPALK
jgi:class 3 adenylate cyclase/tetratricopeptide (TPR) repeat protein